MKETLGIGCPLRPKFLTSLSSALGCPLRIKTARGVDVDAVSLAAHGGRLSALGDTKIEVEYLKGECRIILYAGSSSFALDDSEPVEGLAFSLVRVSITYRATDSHIEVAASEATQLPPCLPGIQAWNHFTKYAYGLGYGSLECDLGSGDQLERLIHTCKFDEQLSSGFTIPRRDPLNSLLYVVWHWVCASYSMGFGVRLAPPFKCNSGIISYDDANRVFSGYLIPRDRIILKGDLLEYLQSDLMVLPPCIDKVYHRLEDPETDFSDYSSDSGSSACIAMDWSSIEPFVHRLNEIINKYQTVVPSVNGIFLDDALWIANTSLECRCSRDIVLLIKSSSSWHHGISSEANLVLFPGQYFRSAIQLRGYVLNRKLVCLEQLFENENLGFIADGANASLVPVKHYMKRIVKQLEQTGETNAVVDVTLFTKTGEVELVNIGALGSLPANLISLEDVYHFYYTGVCDGIYLDGNAEMTVLDGVLIVFVGTNTGRSKKHAFCPKDVGELKFNAPDDMIDFLKFQTSIK